MHPAAALGAPAARHVVLRGVAHGWTSAGDCGSGFVAQFVERATTAGLDLSCAGTSSAPPFQVPPP